jgi:cytochrome b561
MSNQDDSPEEGPKENPKNKDKYDRVSVFIHWLSAFAVGGLAFIGITMVRMPPSMETYTLYQAHKSIGITVLTLTIFRLLWRKFHAAPPPPNWLTKGDKTLATITKHLMIALLVISPLLGWTIVSVSPLNLPTILFDTVQLPHFPIRHWFSDLKTTESLFKTLHFWANITLCFTSILHIMGGIKHQLKDDKSFIFRILP